VKVKLSAAAREQFLRLNEPEKSRIYTRIGGLSKTPPEGDIKKLQRQDGYKLRAGGYRVLFNIKDGKIIVTNIVPRGGA
jgi:mRNA-degrading endonuclease RelE of RelBE toxin-antitoxin system